MTRFSKYFAAAILLMVFTLVSSTGFAQSVNKGQKGLGQAGHKFIDANGDGINDNAPDHDGDGIPNGQDPDYVRTGSGRGHGFIDVDGDGINDYAQDADGDGIPNGRDEDYIRPQDGSGSKRAYGFRRAGSGMGSTMFRGNRLGSGSGICDGSGPNGLSTGRKK